MDLGLTNKKALVAAASRGLGFAVARTLASEGCVVEICSRSIDNARDAAQRIGTETGSSVSAVAVDVSDAAAIGSWIDDAARRLGGLDIVVPNAGGPPAARFNDTDPDAWDDAYRLTLRSAMGFARSSYPHLGAGSAMLYLTSTSAKEPIEAISLSGVFRAGVATLAKTLSREWAPDGIRVNHLIPGRIATERVEQLDQHAAETSGIDIEEQRRRVAASIPLGRYGEPHEFAAAAAFLVSPAASYITGATLQADGGLIHSV